MKSKHHGLDWPTGADDPFDPSEDRSGLVYWARGLPSRVVHRRPEAAELYAAIPPGYTTLTVMERLALYRSGDQVRLWAQRETAGGKGMLQPYQLLLPTGEGYLRLGASWPERFALADAERLSSHTGGPVLACRALDHLDWH
ncbi:hypothetical protein GCM10022243_30870 [Saccharothrix violaceirubra]|uniref:Uncharacterized protein n=1 Tax=Saccharothrix violaceirubra TaxID=413306 RepID=A0A7W7T542_9PSEU|nr:hypothetical protein [Saccharothrix violaceirubra]MBB4966712.1 hypothetical protein [Saccharothrix violaceirubra]